MRQPVRTKIALAVMLMHLVGVLVAATALARHTIGFWTFFGCASVAYFVVLRVVVPFYTTPDVHDADPLVEEALRKRAPWWLR